MGHLTFLITFIVFATVSSTLASPYVMVPLSEESDAVEGGGARQKRAFDRLEESDFGLFKRSLPVKRAFDRLDFSDFSMRRKRAFDRLDFSDFSMRRKRALDRLDFSDFSDMRKRAFDRLESSDFGLFKRSLPVEESREVLIHRLADSIRTLRSLQEEDRQ